MKRTVTALTLVAALSAFSAPSAFAMSEELTMLEAAVGKAFTQVGVRDVDPASLTLSELALISGVINSEDSNSDKARRIKAIIANN